jgi:AcrR family transcriptional regulator
LTEFGFQGATMREICLRAGTDIATLNHHFGDKLGAYTKEVGCLGDVFGSVGKAVAAAASRGGSYF